MILKLIASSIITMANKVDLDYWKLHIGWPIYAAILAVIIILMVCSCVKKCPLYKYAHFGNRSQRVQDFT